jgi:HlyD family secretion protein
VLLIDFLTGLKVFILLTGVLCVNLSAYTVQKGRVSAEILLDGQLKPAQSVKLIIPVNGNLLHIVADGSFVRSGELVCEIDTFEEEKTHRRQQFKYLEKEMARDKQKLTHETERLNDLLKLEEARVDLRTAELNYLLRKHARDAVAVERNRLERQKSVDLLSFYEDYVQELENLGEKGAMSDLELEEQRLKLRERVISSEQLDIDYEQLKEGDLLAIERAEKELERARLRLEFMEQQTVEKENLRKKIRQVTEAELAEIAEKLAELQRNLDSAKMYAPVSGVVNLKMVWGGTGRILYAEGMAVRKNGILGEIAISGGMNAVFEVREKDMSRIRSEADVRFQVQALGSKWHKGRVLEIKQVVKEIVGWQKDLHSLKTAELVVAAVDPLSEMKPKMKVVTRLEAEVAENVLRLPLSCLQNSGSVQMPDKTVRQIKTGLLGTEYAEILSGLQEGDKITCRDTVKAEEMKSAPVDFAVFYDSVKGRGFLHAKDEILQIPMFSSTIQQLSDSGKEVSTGDVLVALDSQKYETELQAQEIVLSEKKLDLQAKEMELQHGLETKEQELADFMKKLQQEQLQLELLDSPDPELEQRVKQIKKEQAVLEKEFQKMKFKIQEDLRQQGYIKSIEFQNTLEGLINARTEYELKSLELSLAETGASRMEVEKQAVKVRKMEFTREIKQELLEIEKEKSRLELLEAEKMLAKAEFELGATKEYLDISVLKAARSGLFVVNETWKQGSPSAYVVNDQVRPGSIVGRLVSMKGFRILGRLAENHFFRLKEGQRVKFNIAGRQDDFFAAVIRRISPSPRRDRWFDLDSYIEVDMDVEGYSRSFQPGSSVQYEIFTGTERKSLSIPRNALYNDLEGFFVYVTAKGEKRRVVPGSRRAVTKGGAKSGVEKVEILEGLSAGEVVYYQELE